MDTHSAVWDITVIVCWLSLGRLCCGKAVDEWRDSTAATSMMSLWLVPAAATVLDWLWPLHWLYRLIGRGR